MSSIAFQHYTNASLQAFKRSGSITKLEVANYCGRPKSLENLLTLPAKLEHFTFNHLPLHSNPVHHWDYNLFRRILLPHRSHLKTLDIRDLAEKGIFNVSDFSILEHLTLSHWALDSSLEATEFACDRIFSAPCLQTFTWDFSTDSYYTDLEWTDFGYEQAVWLRTIGEIAHSRNYALRSIEVLFKPAGDPFMAMTQSASGIVYPWTLLENAVTYLASFGVDLTYDTPSATQEEYEAFVAEILEREAREEAIEAVYIADLMEDIEHEEAVAEALEEEFETYTAELTEEDSGEEALELVYVNDLMEHIDREEALQDATEEDYEAELAEAMEDDTDKEAIEAAYMAD
jgi:hypothetical protein